MRRGKKFLKKLNQFPESVDENRRFDFAQSIIKTSLWTYGIKPIYYNLNNISKKSCLIISNHQSNSDPLLLLHAYTKIKNPVKLSIIAKIELKKKRLLRTVCKLLNVIYIDRNDARNAIAGFNKAKEYINDQNYSVLIFPEGTRSQKKEILEFKPGAFKIAYSAMCPIQPFLIVNSYNCSKFNFFTRKVNIVILPVIPTNKFLHITTKEFAKIEENRYRKELDKY